MSNPKKDKVVAILGTLLFHALIVLVLSLMSFSSLTPLPPGEEGVEVDLGLYNQGKGQEQPDDPTIPEPTTAPETPQEQEEEVIEDDEEIVTQDTEEAPPIETKKIEKPKKEEPETLPEETPEKPEEVSQPVLNPRASFPGKKDPQPGGSEGNTDQPGDQGNPNGLKDIKQYEGQGGHGNGISYDLGGRGHKSLAKKEMDDMPDVGTIVVDIWVDPSGKVIRAKAGAKGTTVSNAKMRKIAEECALASVFDSKKDAPPEQHGTITYTFKSKTSN